MFELSILFIDLYLYPCADITLSPFLGILKFLLLLRMELKLFWT